MVDSGRNGWLCRDRDPEDLAARLLEALAAGRDGVAEAARATAERHDWSRVAERYEATFASALALDA